MFTSHAPPQELCRSNREERRRQDQGFTLIELLVVIIIIGILSAIAIPVFLNQRQKAADTSIKSDLRTIGSSVIALQVASEPVTATNLAAAGSRITPGVQISVHPQGPEHYCLVGTKISGAQNSRDWVFTTSGGLDTSQTACGGVSLVTLP